MGKTDRCLVWYEFHTAHIHRSDVTSASQITGKSSVCSKIVQINDKWHQIARCWPFAMRIYHWLHKWLVMRKPFRCYHEITVLECNDTTWVHLCITGHSWGRRSINMPFYQDRNSHHEDKSHMPGKDVFILKHDRGNQWCRHLLGVSLKNNIEQTGWPMNQGVTQPTKTPFNCIQNSN